MHSESDVVFFGKGMQCMQFYVLRWYCLDLYNIANNNFISVVCSAHVSFGEIKLSQRNIHKDKIYKSVSFVLMQLYIVQW